jgi:hypothetical protein
MNKRQPKTTGVTFKTCPMCGKAWRERQDFLGDPDVQPTGYMADFESLELGLFFFNHRVCKTTMAIKAAEFADLYDGPIYEERLTGTEPCPEYCLHKDELERCPQKCACAHIREVLHTIVHWGKTDGGGG